MSEHPVFELQNLALGYGGRTVVSAEAMVFKSGMVYALLGPNGCGKTTLLRALNGLVKPLSGRIIFCGEELQRAPSGTAQRRRMTLVAQKPVLFNTSLMHNVCYGLRVRGVSPEEARQRARDAITLVGLTRYEKANAQTLSGGEAQRAAIARAIVLQPEALLLDEPTGNVDAVNTAIIEEVILTAARETGSAIIFTTHSGRQARRIAGCAVHFKNGTLTLENPDAPAGYLWNPHSDPRNGRRNN